MNKSILIAGAILVFAGLLFGWMVSGISTGIVKAKKSNWELPQSPDDIAPIAEYLRVATLESGQYGREPAAVIAASETDAPEERAIAFPLIVATARLDGEMIVHLRKEDGSYITAKQNDTLEGDWRVVDITMQQVVAEREGSQVDFTIYSGANSENN